MRSQIDQLKGEVYPAKLMVVTKGRMADEVYKVVQAGAEYLGENRVQEVLTKYSPELMEAISLDGAEIHFIGKLQTNKVKALLPSIHAIHSVDSLKLAQKIDREAEALGRIIPIYLQINATREAQKSGFSPEDLRSNIEAIGRLKSVTVSGLMCMGKKGDPEETRRAFHLCRELANEYDLEGCSMGMSEDFPIALTEGSTFVRIGRRIFIEVES
jgi:PLP dependent protein